MKDQWQPYFSYSASLRVKNAPELHDEISDFTGLEPSECHYRGDIANLNSGRKWNNDIWTYKSNLSESNDLTDHLIFLWNAIEPYSDYFKTLIDKGVDIDVFCGYSSDCDHAGLSIKPEAFEIFQKLKIPFELSIIVC